jgi:C_GCAxxG_C_C family probable redox protein
LNIDFAQVRATAEKYYRDGDFYCSEAVVKTIRDAFGLEFDDSVIAMASGFPVGIGGSGCTCGAVIGGVMALGMVFGRTQAKDERVNKAMALSKELHDQFRANHKSLCCRVLTKNLTLGTPEHLEQCISLTGEVAEAVARIIVRERG